MRKMVALNWQVTELHHSVRSIAHWAKTFPDADIDLEGDEQDCADAINAWLDEGSGDVEDYLIENAWPSTWTQSDVDVELAEAIVVDEEAEEAGG